MRALRLLLALLLPPALGLWLLSTPAAPPQAFTPVDYDCDAADVVILGNSKVESDIDAEADRPVLQLRLAAPAQLLPPGVCRRTGRRLVSRALEEALEHQPLHATTGMGTNRRDDAP